MAGGYAAAPQGLAAVAAQLAALQREVAGLKSAANIRNSTISGGSGLTIKDSGTLTVIDSGGSVIAEIGALPDHAPKLDGTPQVGWVFRRDSGEIAAYCLTNTSGGQQFWAWTDRSANIVLSDDALSGQGLARPYIGYGFGRSRYAEWAGSTSGTFEELLRAKIPRQHPKLRIHTRSLGDLAGTTGEIRILVNGSVAAGPFSQSFTVAEPTTDLDLTALPLYSEVLVTIEARRTAGTGAVRVEVSGCYGVQT